MTTETAAPKGANSHELERVTIRFAGDSGDGMQLTGSQFTRTAAVFGNDVSTMPDYPAEIRAPAGSLPGVSGFQISFSSADIYTPGDEPDVLVAMNPAALRTNIGDLPPGGALIVNSDAFNANNLKKAGYDSNPLADGSLKQYNVFEVPIGRLNAGALEGLGMTSKQVDLTKNFFALGLMFWLYERSMEPTLRWIDERFCGQAGPGRGATGAHSRRAMPSARRPRCSTQRYRVAPAKLAPGHVPQHHRQRGHRAGLRDRRRSWPARAGLWQLPDHARRATSCTRSRRTRTSASRPSRRRTRSPPSAPRSARHTAARSD